MLIINILKKIFGVKFLRTVSAIIYPVKSGIKNRILKFWRLMGFPWRAKKGLLALGERVDYSFRKDWIRIDWQASDFDIHAKEILKARERLNQILVSHTGQPLEKIEADTDRDRFMSGEEARDYGLIDEVLLSRDNSKEVV